jgi:peptidoglycan hydrolase CwlO-like protein
MASELKIGTEKTWFSWAVLAAAVAISVTVYQKFSLLEAISREQFAKLDIRASVLENNSLHANESLRSIEKTLKEIVDKYDNERERVGGVSARITILESRVDRLEKKSDGK